MSTVLSEIKSINWQISSAGFGVIAEGLEDIRQCLDILLRTEKGSDPLRPEFGSDISQYVDSPVNTAVPNIKRSIIEAASIWEKRVVINEITHAVDNYKLVFNVTYGLVDQDVQDSLLVYMDGTPSSDAEVVNALILQAFYPDNPNSNSYLLNLILDNTQPNPIPSPNGWRTLNELYGWAKDNLSYLGRWVQLVDRIVFYVNATAAQTGSISIELLTGSIVLRSFLPYLYPNQSYSLKLSYPVPDGFTTTTLGDGFTNKGDLLSYLQETYSNFGTWSVEIGTVNILGDFDKADFASVDFDTGTQAGYYLVLNSSVLPEGELTVNVNG